MHCKRTHKKNVEWEGNGESKIKQQHVNDPKRSTSVNNNKKENTQSQQSRVCSKILKKKKKTNGNRAKWKEHCGGSSLLQSNKEKKRKIRKCILVKAVFVLFCLCWWYMVLVTTKMGQMEWIDWIQMCFRLQNYFNKFRLKHLTLIDVIVWIHDLFFSHFDIENKWMFLLNLDNRRIYLRNSKFIW